MNPLSYFLPDTYTNHHTHSSTSFITSPFTSTSNSISISISLHFAAAASLHPTRFNQSPLYVSSAQQQSAIRLEATKTKQNKVEQTKKGGRTGSSRRGRTDGRKQFLLDRAGARCVQVWKVHRRHHFQGKRVVVGSQNSEIFPTVSVDLSEVVEG